MCEAANLGREAGVESGPQSNPMIPYIISILTTTLAASVVILFSLRDRNYWRSQYQKLDETSRERERWLYDQLLAVRGFRTVGKPLEPTGQRSSVPAISEDDAEVMADKISERVEVGLMTAGEGQMLLNDAKFGKRTMGEIERILWQRQSQNLNGSVGDIE